MQSPSLDLSASAPIFPKTPRRSDPTNNSSRDTLDSLTMDLAGCSVSVGHSPAARVRSISHTTSPEHSPPTSRKVKTKDGPPSRFPRLFPPKLPPAQPEPLPLRHELTIAALEAGLKESVIRQQVEILFPKLLDAVPAHPLSLKENIGDTFDCKEHNNYGITPDPGTEIIEADGKVTFVLNGVKKTYTAFTHKKQIFPLKNIN